MHMVPDQIQHEVHIAAPVERVWRLLTEPEHVAVWFAFDGAEIDLRPGGAVVYRWKEHGEYHGVVERVEPPHRYSLRQAQVPGERPREGNATLVEFTLTPRDGGTQVRVVERGFRHLDMSPDEQAAHARDNLPGWTGGFAGLVEYAQRALI
jgi:uncharacterized protein YndB with AHSA1/START domain